MPTASNAWLARPSALLAAFLATTVLLLAGMAAAPVAEGSPSAAATHRPHPSGHGGKARQAARRHARQRRRAAQRRRARRLGRRAAIAANAAVYSTPPAPTETVLDAGFEQGLANWNTAGVGETAPTVVSDIVRSGARSSDVTLSGSQGRSELILGGDGGGSDAGTIRFVEGDEYYYGFSFYIQSMVYGRPGAHNLIMQFKSDGEGSPNFGLQLWDYEGDEGDGGRGLWSSGDAMGGDRFLAPVSEQAWHDVVLHFRASRTGAGFYEVFLDGNLVDSRSAVSMIRPDRTYAYIKDGLYRNGGEIPGTSELRLDAARLGRSWDAVAPV